MRYVDYVKNQSSTYFVRAKVLFCFRMRFRTRVGFLLHFHYLQRPFCVGSHKEKGSAFAIVRKCHCASVLFRVLKHCLKPYVGTTSTSDEIHVQIYVTQRRPWFLKTLWVRLFCRCIFLYQEIHIKQLVWMFSRLNFPVSLITE